VTLVTSLAGLLQLGGRTQRLKAASKQCRDRSGKPLRHPKSEARKSEARQSRGKKIRREEIRRKAIRREEIKSKGNQGQGNQTRERVF
jgi:hypothetical protein